MDPLSAVVLEGVVKAVNKGDLDYVRQLLEPLVQVRHANVVKIVPIVEVAMAHARLLDKSLRTGTPARLQPHTSNHRPVSLPAADA